MMKRDIDVSVVVAVYNVERYLPECLESLVGQCGVNAEFVCVDDGSTDTSGKILDEYSRKDPRFRLVHLPENRGTLLARRSGSEIARGKYLMFVDGDDALAPGAAARAVAAIECEGTDFVNFGVAFLHAEPGLNVSPYEKYFMTEPGRLEGLGEYGVLRACVEGRRYTWNLWNKIWRTDLAKRAVAELSEAKIVQGDDLYLVFLMAARARSAELIPDPLYRYRIDSGVSTDGKMNEAKFRRYCDYVEICRCLRSWVGHRPNHPVLEGCLESVFANTGMMFDGILAHRLPKSCRAACLGYLYRRCREADLLRLVQGCHGMTAVDLEAMFAPEPSSGLPKPAFERIDAAVCIVSSDEYAPFAANVVTSIVANARPERNYDVVLLTESMTLRSQARICALARPNISIRVVDISQYVAGLEFYTWAHFTPHTYYRLLVPEIFAAYDKLIYLDSDLVVNRDVADLYAEDVSGWLLAAVLDTQVLAMCERPVENAEIVGYLRDTLGLKDFSRYFQGGVALYNLAEFRKTFSPGHLIREALAHQYRWFDQDVLNVQCAGRIRELANNWNTTPSSKTGRFFELQLPLGRLEAYVAARRDPWIIHYIDRRLPCCSPGADLEEYFWEYARQSPFYETLLSKATAVALEESEKILQKSLQEHEYRLSVLEDCAPMRLWRQFAGGVKKIRNLIGGGVENGS